ncbi:MAG: aminotransferase class I/II-fold pyridoxal phosphate-dependent enzyme [Anaerolineae bacterium]
MHDQTQMPFLESLRTEKQRAALSFHMPGHKQSLPMNPLLADYLGGNLYPADLVEVNGKIDYLHAPKGALKAAQVLAAEAYGADYTFFSVNGSTVANQAAIMSVARAGQKIIMARASHRSVYGGVVLAGVMPLYLRGDDHPEIGFPLAVSVAEIRDLLNQHDDIAAIHITSPNYYGVLSNTRAIAELAHQHGIPLIVDEAHGGHLHFHDALPASATQSGADCVIQSTHKTQGALTQASMLHINDHGLVNLARIGQILSLLQSSSPSALLMASLDVARMQMATSGREQLTRVLDLCQQARTAINALDGLYCYGTELCRQDAIHAYDPTKLIVRVTDLGYTGFEAYQHLRDHTDVDGEFADLRQMIFSISIADTDKTISRLLDALGELAGHPRPPISAAPASTGTMPLPEVRLTPREAYFAPSRPVPITEAIGAVIAENIIPYPPGIPLLVPGEVLTTEHLSYVRHLQSQGTAIVGAEDPHFQQLQVVL